MSQEKTSKSDLQGQDKDDKKSGKRTSSLKTISSVNELGEDDVKKKRSSEIKSLDDKGGSKAVEADEKTENRRISQKSTTVSSENEGSEGGLLASKKKSKTKQSDEDDDELEEEKEDRGTEKKSKVADFSGRKEKKSRSRPPSAQLQSAKAEFPEVSASLLSNMTECQNTLPMIYIAWAVQWAINKNFFDQVSKKRKFPPRGTV